jgi:hypothetical protein
MRVIKTNDVESLSSCFSLDADQVTRIDLIPVLGRILAGVRTEHRAHSLTITVDDPSQKDTTALVRVGVLAVRSHRFQNVSSYPQSQSLLPKPLAQVLVSGIRKDGDDQRL